jgi:hypothetical protein
MYMATAALLVFVLLRAITATGHSVACAVGAGGNKPQGSSNAAKLDADTENLSHQTVSHDFKVALQKARQAKKMTQKDLGMVCPAGHY